MSVTDKLKELIQRRTKIEVGGGESALKTIHTNGQLSARERIDYLLDDHSFVEIGALVKHRNTDFNMSNLETPADGVITGYGTIDGNLVYVYSQDSTVLRGALGEMHAKKICNIYDLALKVGAPIIALIDSAGLRLQEATDALNGFGELFLKQTLASGVIPQITAILGTCGGGSTIIPAISDFTLMTSKNAKLFVNSPNALDEKTASFETLATAKFHSEESGLVDIICESDAEVMERIRELITILPANNEDDMSYDECTDDLNRVSLTLNELDVINTDVRDIIVQVSDNYYFYEVKANYAKEMVTGFIRLNGMTIGVVANQSLNHDATLTTKGCLKAAKFVEICDAFNIPVLSLTDVTGFKATVAEEHSVAKASARLLYAFTNATVPKVNLVLGRGYGSAYIAMNSKHVGADMVYAWPTAIIGMMNPESAVRIMYADEINNSTEADKLIESKTLEYVELQSSAYAAAERGYIDDIIEPAATRKRLIAAFEMLFTKREDRPSKKHGTIV